MNQGKIMTIHCATCGAPAQFDVVTQNYHCPNCGGNTGTDCGRSAGIYQIDTKEKT